MTAQSHINMGLEMHQQGNMYIGTVKEPPQGIVLSAHEISYKVKVAKTCLYRTTEKTILSNITCIFKEGLTAIMGQTGSGKSTLLDILAGRKNHSTVSGQLLLGGMPVPANYKCMVGYVVQDDILMGTLSVRENLHFSAALRLPVSVSSSERDYRVDSVIQELGLVTCADTKVGNDFSRGVSGGERKRCNIGMELIISPSVLFIDEPTTGLDSETSFTVVTFLKKLSLKGCTIILSIHQPRYTIYSLFDNILLLHCGSVLYSGPSHEALGFFATQGFRCQIHNNPPDFFMDVINSRHNTVPKLDYEREDQCAESSVTQGSQLIIGYRQSRLHNRLQAEASAILSQFEGQGGSKGDQHDAVHYATSFFRQMRVVSGRAIKNIIRGPQASLMIIGTSLILATLVLVVFWQLKEDPISGFRERSGLIFFIAICQLFISMPSVYVFINERKNFMYENASGYYRVSVYFLVKVLLDIIPLRTIPVIIMSCIVYFGTGLNQGVDHFFIFMLTLFCAALAGASLCFFISSATRDLAMAQIVIALIFMTMLLFGGVLINFDSINPWLKWLQYLSFFKYAVAALSINEFKDRELCTSNRIHCETGNNFLRIQQIEFQELWHLLQNHVALLLYACGLFILTYISLRLMKKTP